jgi:hypothetical protein
VRDSDWPELRRIWQEALSAAGWPLDREIKRHGIRKGEVPPVLADAVFATLAVEPFTAYVTLLDPTMVRNAMKKGLREKLEASGIPRSREETTTLRSLVRQEQVKSGREAKVYYDRVAHYGGTPDFARAKQAEVLLRAREPHEALLERAELEKRGGLRFFARFVPAFGRRTVAGEAIRPSF